MFLLQMAKVAVSGSDVSLSQTACLRLIRSPLKQDERDMVAQPVSKKSLLLGFPAHVKTKLHPGFTAEPR
jgi:hypothetical protein